jgi:FkbM family methyltransferase
MRIAHGADGSVLPDAFFCCDHAAIMRDEIAGYFRAHRVRAGETVVDAGAAIGMFAVSAAMAGATVWAVEPDARNRMLLRRHAALNHVAARVRVVDRALWNSAGEAEFRSHDSISSLRGVGSLPEAKPALDRVRLETLDAMVRRLGIGDVHVLKMDIEGAEIEALQGAREKLIRCRTRLLLEVYHMRDGCPTHERVIPMLRSWGIDVTPAAMNAGLLHVRPEDYPTR